MKTQLSSIKPDIKVISRKVKQYHSSQYYYYYYIGKGLKLNLRKVSFGPKFIFILLQKKKKKKTIWRQSIYLQKKNSFLLYLPPKSHMIYD